MVAPANAHTFLLPSLRKLRVIAAAALAGGALALPAADPPVAAPNTTASNTRRGALLYGQHCAACHGVRGDGDGPASVWLFPKPRNFSAGLFKIQSTPAGSLPTDDDLHQSITRGLAGSSMPAFGYLSEVQRRDLVDYVKHLTAYTGPDGKQVNRFAEAQAKGELKPPLVIPPEPPVTFDAITKGKEIFVKLQCAACHGESGAGDGPSAPTLKDNAGIPVVPRDFNSGAFRGGATGHDLYLRIATGLAGTPMPPFGDDIIPPADRWTLVQYIQSLRRKEAEINDMLAPADGFIPVHKVKAIPTDPLDTAWDRIDTVRVPVNPIWPEKDPITAVAVHVVTDGKRLAVHCSWRDGRRDDAPIGVNDFQDAIAVQFSLTGATPFLGMGDPANPVNVWQWKAAWQAEVDGARPDVDNYYAAMHVDTYFQPERQFRTATSAGNLIAATHPSPVEDANARGFGTLQSQPVRSQNVSGKGLWRDGSWSVIFVRALASRDQNDVQLKTRTGVPLAFAVWDGRNRDRNGRKVISNWYQLRFEL